MKEDILLIIPDKPDEERDVLADKWAAKNGTVLRIGKFWIKPDTQGKKIALYGNDSFCLIEFNSSWGAGLNFCDPEKVLDCTIN